MSSNTTCAVAVVELADGTDMFDQVTRQAMGLPAEEFLERWDRGDYEGYRRA